jgi:uncharacterized protein with HEPN domain
MGGDLETLALFREATRAMIDHTAGLDRHSFVADRKARSSVLFEIVIQGECTKRLSPSLRSRHPNVRWNEIAGMRDRIVHSFDKIDPLIAWNVAASIAPELLNDLDLIIDSEAEGIRGD